MFQKLTLAALLLSTLTFTSCVSSKKFKAATAEAQAAKATVEELTKKNSDLQGQLNDAISSNKLLAEERDRYQSESENAKRQLNQLQSALDKYLAEADAIEKKAADKLADYTERGADVQYKDGLIYITLEDELLFKKGTNQVSRNGETALGSVASILNENPSLKVTVIGHTDDRAGRGGDNWSASTERANSVVRLLRTMKIDPNRLTAAGQGQFNAVADNSTVEGRAKNKRTEIVLSPEPLPLLQRK